MKVKRMEFIIDDTDNYAIRVIADTETGWRHWGKVLISPERAKLTAKEMLPQFAEELDGLLQNMQAKDALEPEQ
jgi:hypothetical protein